MPVQGRPSVIQGGRRVEFDHAEFELLLEEQGYFARWTKAMLCPNRDTTQEDHHVIDCSLCGVNGFVYFDPIEIKVLVTSYGTKQLFMPESRYEPGTAYFTARSAYKLSFWDKIELLNAKTRFGEVKKVNPRSVNYKLKYPALSIERVLSNTGRVLNPPIIQPDGSVTFAEAPGGDFFSISYFYHPTYIMIDLLHSVRNSRTTVGSADEETNFPTQAVGRLDFLVRDEAAT
jgi:hypothetical protein